MTESMNLGITLSKSIDFKVNWKEFSVGLVESAANFALKGWADGGASGLVALTKLVSSFSVEESVEARAWRLIVLAFAWSLDDLNGSNALDVEQLRAALREAMDEAKSHVDNGEYQLTTRFFDIPSSLPLYQMMRDKVVKRRVEIGLPNTFSDNAITYKLDTAFTLGIYEVWSRNIPLYNAIYEQLKGAVSTAAERELNWKSYRHQLIHSFEVLPTFGQEQSGISLSQLYIPLRAYWLDDSPENRRERNADGRIPKNAHGLLLDKSLDEWALNGESSDWLRLIGGGPGSGKSTTLKALAKRLAESTAVRPLFVPLQHIGISGDLRSAINSHFIKRSGSAFDHEPLGRSSVEGGPPLVLIFDGLDELVTPNENAKETISQFVHKMNSLVNELRGEHAPILKVIVSGRMLAFQSARKIMTIPAHGSLEVYGYLPAATRGLTHPNDIWKLDQRLDWWEKYASALNLNSNLPDAFKAKELESITHEPLLSYLLVLAGFASHNWERAAENPNRIYATLMSDIYTRGWGGASTQVKSMTSREFNLLMQTIGLAAWLGGDSRVASESSFLNTLAVTRAEDAWNSFNNDKGPDVTNLAMNFYLKADDKNGRGFEFTHKSFGEYLAALAILEVAIEIHSMASMRLDYVLQEWYRATNSGKISEEIVRFLRQEVRLRIQENIISQELAISVKASFERIVDACAGSGFPVTQTDVWRALEKRQLSAEAAAWAVLNAFVRAIISCLGPSDVALDAKSIHGVGIRNLLVRHAGFDGLGSIVAGCLTALKVKNVYIVGFYGGGLDLSFCEINHLMMDGCKIYGATLNGGHIEDLSIHSSQMSDFSILDTEIDEIRITNTTFTDSDLAIKVKSAVVMDEETIILNYPNLPSLEGKNVRIYERGDDESDMVNNIPKSIEFIQKISEDKRAESDYS